MPKVKWSSFPSVGPVTTGDETVGLRAGTNVRFDANQFQTLDVDNININGNVISSTDTNGNIQLIPNGTGQVEINDPGLETGGILVDGAAFETAFRVNDIGGADPAQMILHRHSTTWEPIILSARSNSNTTGHATVTAGMPVLNIYGTGWLNSYYGTVASITFSADTTGTLADGSAPGRLQFNVTPNGALLPVEAMRINNTGVATLAKDAVINTVNIGLGGGNIATNTRVGVSALSGNTTGARNVAIGYQALQNSNAANSSDNVVIGSNAAKSATTIYSMTLLGSNAGLSYTTSNNSVAVGTSALRTATTAGDRCVAIGVNALYSNNGSINTAIGYRAGEVYTGTYGVFVGETAGVAITTGADCTLIGSAAGAGITSGSNHTILGRQAGSSITTASNTTAIGYRALALNTAANNTAVGSGAMDACTSGTGVAVGKDALGALTTGASCTAVGTSALAAITTASFSSAFGFEAGLNHTGVRLSAFGYQASRLNTSGADNSSFGHLSLTTNSTGSNNSAFGAYTLAQATTASGNTAMGQGALYPVTTGGNNTSIGYGSGNSGATGAVDLTTGTSNTMLGYRSCPNAADAAGTIGIGADSVPEKATGATSADNGPGIAIGSAAFKVGFRGDGTIYAAAGASAGYWRVKVNGTFYKIELLADV